jgi:hypothetical protein
MPKMSLGITGIPRQNKPKGKAIEICFGGMKRV